VEVHSGIISHCHAIQMEEMTLTGSLDGRDSVCFHFTLACLGCSKNSDRKAGPESLTRQATRERTACAAIPSCGAVVGMPCVHALYCSHVSILLPSQVTERVAGEIRSIYPKQSKAKEAP